MGEVTTERSASYGANAGDEKEEKKKIMKGNER